MVPSDRISSSRRRPGSHPLNLTHRRDPGPFDCLAGAQDRLRRDDDLIKNDRFQGPMRPLPQYGRAQTKWGPASLPTPTIRFCPAGSVPPHPGPLLSRSAARKTMRCGARRSNPATVWSAPFRGPAAPGKPFIISSCVRRSGRCPSDGLHFLYPIGSVSTRGNRYVP